MSGLFRDCSGDTKISLNICGYGLALDFMVCLQYLGVNVNYNSHKGESRYGSA